MLPVMFILARDASIATRRRRPLLLPSSPLVIAVINPPLRARYDFSRTTKIEKPTGLALLVSKHGEII